MLLSSSLHTVTELCNLMTNHRTGVTVSHVSTEETSNTTYHVFVTSDGRSVLVASWRDNAGYNYWMRIDDGEWTGVGPVRG